ncbi:MAG: hypothetical protein ACJ739_16435 [Acidimicrobiales bacterium]
MTEARLAPTIGERIERSVVAQVLIAILIVTALLAQVITHLPGDSAVEDELGESASYLVRLGAVESQWGVFAPNPRSTSLKIEGRVTFEDGSTAVWHLPEGARIGGNLRYYRWRKWLERVRSDDFRGLWEPTCQWIASLYDGFESPVATVELVRLFHENTLTGTPPPYDEFTYHTCTPDGGA